MLDRSNIPCIRYEVPSVPSSYAWHAVSQVDPGTNETRSGGHGQPHLPDDDQKGENHSGAGRIAHQDDRCGKYWCMGIWRGVDEVEIGGEAIEKAARLGISQLMWLLRKCLRKGIEGLSGMQAQKPLLQPFWRVVEFGIDGYRGRRRNRLRLTSMRISR